MATKPVSKPAAEPTITITVDGQDRDIFMSFGLLDALSRIIGDTARIPSIALDPELRQKVLECALAVRKKSGKIEQEIDFDDTDISIEDVERVIDWVSDHVMSFFIRSLQKTVAVTTAREEEMKALVSSLGGLQSLASKNPSSGV